MNRKVMNMKWFCSVVMVILFVSVTEAFSQQPAHSAVFESLRGNVEFTSDAPLELINASSSSLRGFINPAERTFAFSIPTSSFKGFNSLLQQEHFYENYIESHKFPNATFNGRIIEDVDLAHGSEYSIRAKGILDIHGVKSERIIKVNIRNQDGIMYANADFYVLLADHNIIIPKMVWQKIAEKIRVVVEIEFDLTSLK